MPTFWYKALGAQDLPSEGTIVATSRREALQRLVESGRHPVDLREQAEKENGKVHGFSLRRRPIRLATFSRQLATLAQSGVPIVKSLNVLIEQQRDARARHILTDVREGVQTGSTFAEALAKHPRVFPKLMTSMVAVGEKGGTLDQELLELSELHEREEELKGEVLAAVAYPVLVLIAGLVSTFILVVFFIPKLESMFEDVGQALPVPTRMLLWLSHALTDYRWTFLIGLVFLFVGVRFALRQPNVVFALDRFKLRVPWIGTLLKNLAVARLSRILGTLTHGGVSIVEALDIVAPVMGNAAIAATVRDITVRVRTGESLASLMKGADVFPPLSVQMVAVGEETGQLDQMLLRVADAYDRETLTATRVMTSLLAPALILFVAGVVGFILISMMLPIFQLSTVMR